MSPESILQLSLGVPEIDKEHLELIILAEELETVFVVEDRKRLLDRIFVVYQRHCLIEEEFMRKIDYPNMKNHITAHNKELTLLAHATGEEPVEKVTAVLYHTINDHVKTYDLPMAYYAHSRMTPEEKAPKSLLKKVRNSVFGELN
jgi:hemerythrin-like metal-binding protein